MVYAIWLLAVLLLLLWSAFLWMAQSLLGMVAGLPWEQIVTRLKAVNPPEPFGQWWVFSVDLLAPMLQWSMPALQGLLALTGAMVPVLVWVVWALGALALLLLAVAATIGLVLWRKKRAGVS